MVTRSISSTAAGIKDGSAINRWCASGFSINQLHPAGECVPGRLVPGHHQDDHQLDQLVRLDARLDTEACQGGVLFVGGQKASLVRAGQDADEIVLRVLHAVFDDWLYIVRVADRMRLRLSP